MVVYLSRTASVSVTHPEWITSGQKPNREGVPINARLGMVSVLQWPGRQIKQSKAIQTNRLTPSTCLMYIILMQALVIVVKENLTRQLNDGCLRYPGASPIGRLLAANSINQVESAWLVYLGNPTLNLREGVTVVNWGQLAVADHPWRQLNLRIVWEHLKFWRMDITWFCWPR